MSKSPLKTFFHDGILLTPDVVDVDYIEPNLSIDDSADSFMLSQQVVMKESGLTKFTWSAYFQDVQYFDLSYNSIRDVFIYSDKAGGSHHITFNLTFNNCPFININIVNIKTSDNSTFLLDHNPFECDCQIESIFTPWWKNFSHLNYDFGDAVCVGPDHMKGRFVRD